jgi:pilus assembly protein Flp/PilA
MRLFLRFLRNESGATAIEYVAVSGIISAGLIVVFSAIGSKVNTKFLPVSSGLN